MRSKTKEIVAHAKAGMAPRDIAKKVNVDQTAVYSALKYARSKGHKIPLFCTKPAGEADVNPMAQIVVPNRLHALLLSEADRRGKTPTELAQRILEAGLLGGAELSADTFQKPTITETSNV